MKAQGFYMGEPLVLLIMRVLSCEIPGEIFCFVPHFPNATSLLV